MLSKLGRGIRLMFAVLAVIFLILPADTFGQSTKFQLSFDAADIHASNSTDQWVSLGVLPDGHVRSHNATLRMIIAAAYNVDVDGVSGGPAWLDSERFDINAKTAPSVTITNYMNYGLPNALPRPAFPDEHRLQFSDVASLTHGHHTFKMGVDVSPIHELLINLFQGGGVYTYSGANNYSNWVADVAGINLGDNLTGRHFTTFVQVDRKSTRLNSSHLVI